MAIADSSISLDNPVVLDDIYDSSQGNPADFFKKNLDHRFVTQIGNQPFFIELWIYNQFQDFKPFAVPFLFVDGLAIEETLDDWNTKGWFILSNHNEMLERGALSDKETPQINAPFLVRNDGRNKLSVKIFPIPTGNQEKLPKERWEMAFDFVIYDIEDLKTDTAGRKARKFYFWDERYQHLLERNLEWSTALYGPNKGNPLAPDLQRAMPTSEAIKSIIQTAASDESKPGSSNIRIGFDKNNESDSNIPSKLDVFDDENWDAGVSGEEGLTLYTSPADFCSLDDINYCYSLFKSQDGSPAFLELQRYDTGLDQVGGGKKFSLISLKKIIDNAENLQVEHIIIQDNQDPFELTPYMQRAPITESSMIKNFQSQIASRITNYKFSPMVSVDDLDISNRPVHNYDFANGQFNIFFDKNRAEDVLNKMKETVKDGLYSFNKDEGGEGQLLFNINKTKKTGLLTNNAFVPQTFFPRDLSYVSMAKDFVFLNQTLYFNAPGLTLRAPGCFIAVDSFASTEQINPFDDRFLGQWLINKVVHFFTRDRYTTDVICTKVDLFNKWFDEIDKE